jgi:hypothetical protein
MVIQAATLFTHAPNGRIVTANEPGGAPAPRFFAGRTRQGTVRRYRHDLPEPVVQAIERAVGEDRLGDPADQPPPWLATVRSLLAGHAPITGTFHGPAFRFSDIRPARADAVLVTEANQQVLHGPFALLRPVIAQRSPIVAVIEDDRAVAVCYCSRRGADAAEAGVETLPGQRRRGHASAAVAAWARAVRAHGRMPLYSTTWDNTASRGVARRLGLSMYGVDIDVT